MTAARVVLSCAAACLAAAALALHAAPLVKNAPYTAIYTLNVGILESGADELEKWSRSAIVRSLEERFGEQYNLNIRTLSPNALAEELREGKLDFFLSDTGTFSRMRQRFGATAIASVQSLAAETPETTVGAVFLVRADSPIQTLADMRGKRLMMVTADSFADSLIPLGEIARRGWNPEKFFGEISFSGQPAGLLLANLESGQCDAAALRACVLEHLARMGWLPEGRFRVVEPRQDTRQSLRCQSSTSLYPHIIFAATNTASPERRKRATLALLSIPAFEGGQWTVPASTASVDRLYRDLRIGHYAFLRHWNARRFLEEWAPWLLLAAVLVAGILLHGVFSERLVRIRTRELSEAVEEENRIRGRLAKLEKTGLVGVLSNMIAHELKQPLSAMRCYIEGLRDWARQKDLQDELVRGILDELDREASRTADIVEHVRHYAKTSRGQRIDLDLRDVAAKAVESFRKLAGRSAVTVNLSTAAGPLPVSGDPLELELVLINLMRNAASAIAQQKAEPVVGVRLEGGEGNVRAIVRNSGHIDRDRTTRELFAPRVSSGPDGMGIGLAIVARIVESHGGELWLGNSNDGVEAWMTLPRRQA